MKNPPLDADSIGQSALKALKLGDFQSARVLYELLLHSKASQSAKAGLALSLFGLGAPLNARALFIELISSEPLPTPRAREDLCSALISAAQFDLLERFGRRLLDDGALSSEGALCLLQAKRAQFGPTGALAWFDGDPTITPCSLDGHVHAFLGDLSLESGIFQRAVSCYQFATGVVSSSPPLRNNFALALMKVGRLTEAENQIESLVNAFPDYLLARATHAQILFQRERLDEALGVVEIVLGREPNMAEAWVTKAQILAQMWRFNEAEHANAKALFLNRASSTARANEAFLAEKQGNFALACTLYEKLCLEFPDPQYRVNFGATLLANGEFAKGWNLYRYRLVDAEAKSTRALFSDLPQWEPGSTSQHVVVWKEQGIGDQILYLSALADLLECSQKVSLVCDPRLFPLVSRRFPAVLLHEAKNVSANQFDAQLSVVDLPRFFRRSIEAFPAHAQFIEGVDPASVERFRERFKAHYPDSLFCGISWKSHRPLWSRHKSISLVELLDALPSEGVVYINLQYDSDPTEVEQAARETGRTVWTLDEIDLRNDLVSVAEIGRACDHNISTSNSTAHLLGSVGAALHVLLPDSLGLFYYWHKPLTLHPWYPQISRQWYPLSPDRHLKVPAQLFRRSHSSRG